jgi:hypothetical protein
MRKHGDYLDKTRLPSSESWPDILKYPPIPQLPYAPKGTNNNLCKIGAQKRFPSCCDRSNSISRNQSKLEIIPNSSAKSTIEEQVSLVFINYCMTKYAIMILCNMPMSSYKLVIRIYSILKNRPSKEYMFGCAFAFANPT